MTLRLAIAGTAAALAAAVLLLGGVFAGSPAAPAAAPAPDAQRLLAPWSAPSAARLIRDLRAQDPDAKTLTLLGLAYQQRVKETGDPNLYRLSEQALRRALRLAPGDRLALTGLGGLALIRHDFRGALVIGRRLTRAAPTAAPGYGIVGDALLELGRYEEAFAAFDRMGSLKPSIASYARISYARELLGDQRGAVAAMELAADAAAGDPRASSWAHLQLGDLASRLSVGRRHFRRALELSPNDAAALDALADTYAAEGRFGEAIPLQQRAVARVPDPHYVEALGDMYARSGRKNLARAQYARYLELDAEFRANGSRTELEAALFRLDHGIDLRAALRLAKAGRAARPSVLGDDVYAWALARNGRCKEALPSSERALRLGGRDAAALFHRGMIERCLGRVAESRRWLREALRRDPNFSILWSPRARQLARIG